MKVYNLFIIIGIYSAMPLGAVLDPNRPPPPIPKYISEDTNEEFKYSPAPPKEVPPLQDPQERLRSERLYYEQNMERQEVLEEIEPQEKLRPVEPSPSAPYPLQVPPPVQQEPIRDTDEQLEGDRWFYRQSFKRQELWDEAAERKRLEEYTQELEEKMREERRQLEAEREEKQRIREAEQKREDERRREEEKRIREQQLRNAAVAFEPVEQRELPPPDPLPPVEPPIEGDELQQKRDQWYDEHGGLRNELREEDEMRQLPREDDIQYEQLQRQRQIRLMEHDQRR